MADKSQICVFSATYKQDFSKNHERCSVCLIASSTRKNLSLVKISEVLRDYENPINYLTNVLQSRPLLIKFDDTLLKFKRSPQVLKSRKIIMNEKVEQCRKNFVDRVV